MPYHNVSGRNVSGRFLGNRGPFGNLLCLCVSHEEKNDDNWEQKLKI